MLPLRCWPGNSIPQRSKSTGVRWYLATLNVDSTDGGDDERSLQRDEADVQMTRKSADLNLHRK